MSLTTPFLRLAVRLLNSRPSWARSAMTGGVVAAVTLGLAAPVGAQMISSGNDDGYHVVDQGDTLWDLSGQYFGDNYEWPRVWSYNPHITNPHWIYPGDIVYLQEKTAPQENAAPVAQAEPNVREQGLFLPLAGFLSDEEPEFVGRIIASPKEANMLAEGDAVWVGFGEDGYSSREKEDIDPEDRQSFADPGRINAGQKFAVVRPAGQLTDSEGEVIGTKFLVLGAVQVTQTREKYYDEAVVSQSWQEMVRGDLLIPYEQQLKVIKATKAGKDEPGARIIDAIQPGSLYGEHHYVYVDKGAADGVRPGNRLFVYQRNEGLHGAASGDAVDPEVPWQRVGQVMVVDVTESYATAIVTDSSREITVGDRLEMYEGY